MILSVYTLLQKFIEKKIEKILSPKKNHYKNFFFGFPSQKIFMNSFSHLKIFLEFKNLLDESRIFEK